MEFLLTAEAFPAARALELGLLNEIVPPDELLDRAFGWARRILANGPLAVRATKESVVRGMSGTLREAYAIESELSKVVFASHDAQEGPAAFTAKREPRWENR
jgi:enoyl-CoA hydratase